ncbi:J domain-containing protein [Chitinophaga rhizophila]|uniref:J domain-containing protein n=1 Tax=Chitinophaga rhizophila TaxID=2866212 RepID=A0ABS7G785_9BACT|nr:J domain-containing protein [Chitinophaga rhizophila]MBW8683499.1 J domain-containing protein [Chitinophaga rhizophila]
MKKKKGFTEGYKTYDTSGGYGSAEDWRQALKDRLQQEADIQNEDFEILEVPVNVSEKDLKSAYRKLLQKWHPDKNPDDPENAKIMTQCIIEAYERIKAIRRFK